MLSQQVIVLDMLKIQMTVGPLMQGMQASLALGRYIAFLDTDDFLDDKLKKQFIFMEK